jgi:tetratricopeptide (TPR) repeat protein
MDESKYKDIPLSAEKKFLFANEYLKEGDYLNAKNSMYAAVLMDNTNAEYYCFFADVFFQWWEKLSEPDKVNSIVEVSFFIDNFNQLKSDKYYAECYYNRGLAYNTLANYKKYDYELKKETIGDYQNAINDFSKAIIIDGSKEKYYEERGLLHRFVKKNNEAIADFNKAIQLNEVNSEYYFLRGLVNEERWVHENIGNIDDTIKDYAYAIDLDNSVPYYYRNLGDVFKHFVGDYEKAYQCYIRGREVAKHPNMLKELNDSIMEINRLRNPEIKPEENNDNSESKASLFGTILNAVKSGISEVGNEYNKKMEKIEQNKERFQNKSIDELRQIVMDSKVFEEKVAAKRLLEERGG